MLDTLRYINNADILDYILLMATSQLQRDIGICAPPQDEIVCGNQGKAERRTLPSDSLWTNKNLTHTPRNVMHDETLSPDYRGDASDPLVKVSCDDSDEA